MSDTPPSLDAPGYVESMLARAARAGASDVHVEPIEGGIEIRFRIDGLLEPVEKLPTDVGRSVALRLMVMAQLLTYRLEIPQEGRIHWADPGADTAQPPRTMDLRLAIMPVAHGLRAVVRMPAELSQPRSLQDLGLPAPCLQMLEGFARTDAGMLLVTGPAGSGKTTTIYALLEHIAHTSPGTSIIALEDPIERLVTGVTQIEVTPQGQMTYERAIKSILRQDPQVLMLGEIRDAPTASIAVQAALSGHRLIATMHAGEPATAISRLLEMGLETYQVTSSIYGVLTQRLVRKLYVSPPPPYTSPPVTPPLPPRAPIAPPTYKGRIPLAEFGILDDRVRAAILARADSGILRNIFDSQPNHVTLRLVAQELIARGTTDWAEIRRVLGD
jgi:type II secretory ATPase GspE/PulE/Tfp pilus assembly ATPase PilB-like protein